jgi:hypothetical protein
MVVDVSLGGASIWVNHRSSFRNMSQQKLPDKPAAAEGLRNPPLLGLSGKVMSISLSYHDKMFVPGTLGTML